MRIEKNVRPRKIVSADQMKPGDIGEDSSGYILMKTNHTNNNDETNERLNISIFVCLYNGSTKYLSPTAHLYKLTGVLSVTEE